MPRLSRDRVCCAIPLHNIGIYGVIGQFFVVSLTTGVLCFSAPNVVAVSIPGFGAAILGAVCIVIAVLQVWALYAVMKCNTKQYQLYVRTSIPAIALAVILALVWIVISAVHHTAAVNACLAQFLGGGNNAATGTSTINGVNVGTNIGTSGQTICNIFTWVQLGIMIFLFLFVTIAEIYFCQVARIFGAEQRLDANKYNSVLSSDAINRASYTKPLEENGRAPFKPSMYDTAESKTSLDYGSRDNGHAYKPSALRYEQKPSNGYENPFARGHGDYQAPSYPPQRTGSPYYGGR